MVLFFRRRGRQSIRPVKRTDFSFNMGSTGARWVCKAADELTKNRREDDEGFDWGLMYEKPSPNCPVVSFELYLSHLNPLNEFLCERNKRNVGTFGAFGTTTWWWENVHLARKWKNISREAKLSKCYTNHSIRVTAVTILDKSGFEARHITAVSGHKNEVSIRSYRKTEIYTKKKMSETK